MKVKRLLGVMPLLCSASAGAVHLPRLANGNPQLDKMNFPRGDQKASWPYGPFSTKGRDIVNSRGDVIQWAGVNWPGHLETMIPEGLEFKSAEDILDDMAGIGFNFIRLTYAVEMIDQIYDRNGKDVPLEEAMIEGLGQVNGTKVTRDIVSRNPQWTSNTTRLEIWSDITRLALQKGIFIHPDTQMSTAEWCCSHTDGNGWFDDVSFDVSRWHRGMAYMATWAKEHSNVVSMSLHNELRESWNRTNLDYNWMTLVGNMSAGADTIYNANPDLLITWSGMQYDEDLSALTTRKNLLTAPCYKCTAVRDAHRRPPVYFDLDSYPWANKIVWELHLYDMSEDIDTGTCPIIEAAFYRNGFNALGIQPPADGCRLTGDCPPAQRLTPVILSEFGNGQDSSLFNATLQDCIRTFTEAHKISWAMWAYAGSYRIRSGAQGVADTWGLTNADWSGWNYPEGMQKFWKPWVKAMNPT
ncbi:glycoside hydrolase family 5 protein [Penicillium cataractarum]|uniref:Glycoside hydrolase family 5 protein n=1 Tax=Penicillium cataractarum TaxID=2100454 RepID=A0A9W9VXC0_9EURO|nr:glycoside hydrolase family 5 protein [Penicillium cataractarum]KAJ5390925.1 glycoside hydrolase family 5 protein [Penicillium cataractarum]